MGRHRTGTFIDFGRSGSDERIAFLSCRKAAAACGMSCGSGG